MVVPVRVRLRVPPLLVIPNASAMSRIEAEGGGKRNSSILSQYGQFRLTRLLSAFPLSPGSYSGKDGIYALVGRLK